MTNSELEAFKDLIQAQIVALETQSRASAQSRATVVLDQQSVGRLSRMDAIQQQSMANATEARRTKSILGLKAALQRIDDGEFGFCTDCGDDIRIERLHLNPALLRCISCAKG